MSVLYVDIDCFYVQAECYRRPELRGRPVVIQQVQHGGFIAISYEARASGVKRGDGIGATGPRSVGEVKKRCPDLVIVPVDMPHNRFVSQEVEAVLRSLSPSIVLQRNSVDDFCIECAAEIERDDFEVPLSDDSVQVKVLRAHNGCIDEKTFSMNTHNAADALRGLTTASTTRGARFALHVQRTVFERMRGMTCSIGVASSKVLARMIVSRNKPRGLTILADLEEGSLIALLGEIPVARVHGLRGLAGQHISSKLASLVGKPAENVMLADLQQLTKLELAAIFDAKTAQYLSAISCGADAEAITDRGQPKSILVELSWDPIESDIQIYEHLRPLVEDLLHRVLEDTRRFNGRRPTKLTIKWRRTARMLTGSQVLRMPSAVATLIRRANEKPEAIPAAMPDYPKAVEECCETGMQVLRRILKDIVGPREVNRLAVVATDFVPGGPSLLSFLRSRSPDDGKSHFMEETGAPAAETKAATAPKAMVSEATALGVDHLASSPRSGDAANPQSLHESHLERPPFGMIRGVESSATHIQPSSAIDQASSGDECVVLGSKVVTCAVPADAKGDQSESKRRKICKGNQAHKDDKSGKGATLFSIWKKDETRL